MSAIRSTKYLDISELDECDARCEMRDARCEHFVHMHYACMHAIPKILQIDIEVYVLVVLVVCLINSQIIVLTYIYLPWHCNRLIKNE
jgi:hypothetical protein